MKVLVLYPHPPEPDGVSMQGHYLIKGLRENGVKVLPCDRENNIQKEWSYLSFKPDAVIGIGLTTGCVYHLIDIWRKQC